jgi:hypothetical protein
VLLGIGVIAAIVDVSVHGVVVRGRRRGRLVVVVVVDGGVGWFDARIM